MATLLGSLLVSLGLESGEFKSGLSAAEKELQRATKRIQAIGQNMADVGKNLSLAVSVPLIALGKTAVTAAMESRDAIAAVNASLASMGDAAGRTSEQLQGLASGLMRQSLYDDDEILRKVTANLLTFGKVSTDVFDRAQAAAVDMSAKLGQDLQSSAIQLGKALNDPVKGITALQRVGVSFTADQKALIQSMAETGRVADAQRLILAEVEKQFRGSAQAARDADPFAAMKQSFAEFQETVGGELLKAMPAITGAITALLEAFNSLSPEMQKVVVIGGVLAAALGPVLIGLGSIVSIAAPLIAGIGAVAGVISGFAAAAAASAPMIGGLIAALSPILVPLAAVAAAVGAVYLAWKNWDKIKAVLSSVGSAVSGWWSGSVAPALSKAWEGVKRAGQMWVEFHLIALRAIAQLVTGVRDWIVGKLGQIWDWAIKKVEAVGKAFYNLYDAVVGHSYVPDMVDGIADQMARLDAVMVKPVDSATKKAGEAFKALADKVQPILDRLFPEARALADFRSDAQTLSEARAGGAISASQYDEALRRLRGGTNEGASLGSDANLADGELTKIQFALSQMTDATKRNADGVEVANVRVVQSFKDMADATLSALDRVASAVKGGGFLDILSSVVGLGLQLGSVGLFGSKVQANINSVPKYAGGTRFHPGGLAMVGERGRELVNLPRGSQVIPNSQINGMGGSRIQVEASPYFDVRVDGRIVTASPAIMAGGAQVSQARMARQQTRRLA